MSNCWKSTDTCDIYYHHVTVNTFLVMKLSIDVSKTTWDFRPCKYIYIKHNWDSYRQLAVLHTYTAVLISDMSTKRTARLHGLFAQNGPERRRYQKQLVAILTDWWSTPTKHHFILKHLQLHCSNLRLSLCNIPVSRDSETVYNDTDRLMSCIAHAGAIFSFEYFKTHNVDACTTYCILLLAVLLVCLVSRA